MKHSSETLCVAGAARTIAIQCHSQLNLSIK